MSEEMEEIGGYVPVSDEYGNELCVYAKDYPMLAKMPRGTEVEFIVRGSIKGGIGNNVGEGKEKIWVYIWDAKLKSCDVDSKMSHEGIKKALMGSGRQVGSQIQDTFVKESED